MNEANMLLRSAYAIAQRKGKNTNWVAFENSIRNELLKQVGLDDCEDEQIILRATCTPRTYKKQYESI